MAEREYTAAELYAAACAAMNTPEDFRPCSTGDRSGIARRLARSLGLTIKAELPRRLSARSVSASGEIWTDEEGKDLGDNFTLAVREARRRYNAVAEALELLESDDVHTDGELVHRTIRILREGGQ